VDGGRKQERRKCMRYTLAFPIRYRVVPRNGPPLTGRGTRATSARPVSAFSAARRCRWARTSEMVAQWPAKCGRALPPGLEDDGIRVRSNQGSARWRVTSHKLCADTSATLSYRARRVECAMASWGPLLRGVGVGTCPPVRIKQCESVCGLRCWRGGHCGGRTLRAARQCA